MKLPHLRGMFLVGLGEVLSMLELGLGYALNASGHRKHRKDWGSQSVVQLLGLGQRGLPDPRKCRRGQGTASVITSP